ncbi:MAG: hypothetical protein WED09_10715 [Homoserinimonas sp.]
MNEREHPEDPAEGPEEPNAYEPKPSQPEPGQNGEATGIGVDDIGEAMPGAGRLNESTEDPDSSDPDLRTDGPAPLP